MYQKKTVAAIIPLRKVDDDVLRFIHELDATGVVDDILAVSSRYSDKLKLISGKTRARLILTNNRLDISEAIKKGFAETSADLIITIEAGRAYEAGDIGKLLAYSGDFDCVFGSRTHTPLIGKNSGMTFTRRLADDLFGKMISILFLSSNLTDVGCTLCLTNQKTWRKIARECRADDELMFTQWLIAVAKKRLKFIEVPVHFNANGVEKTRNDFPFLAGRALRIIYYVFKAKFG